jgi:hypothetical protein
MVSSDFPPLLRFTAGFRGFLNIGKNFYPIRPKHRLGQLHLLAIRISGARRLGCATASTAHAPDLSGMPGTVSLKSSLGAVGFVPPCFSRIVCRFWLK